MRTNKYPRYPLSPQEKAARAELRRLSNLKNNRVIVNLDYKELDKFNSLFLKSGLKRRSDFARKALTNAKIKKSTQTQNFDYSRFLAEIKRIGNNINQIAFALNSIKKTADKKDFDTEILERELSAIAEHLEALKKEASK